MSVSARSNRSIGISKRIFQQTSSDTSSTKCHHRNEPTPLISADLLGIEGGRPGRRKAAPAEAWLCQHPNCKHKWTRTTDLDWEECEKCNLHLICCEHPGAKELMVAHEMTCDGNFKSSKVPHRPGAGKRKRGRKPAVAAAGDKTPSATYKDEDGENDENAHDDNDSDESEEQPTLARQFAAIETERATLPPRKRRKTVFKISAPKKHK